MAAAMGLPVADKPDSQDICFVPDGRYGELIRKLRPDAAEAGDIVNLEGRVLGRHEGIIDYTVGQRRGLGLGGGEPLYVIRIDAEQRQVVAGPREALRQSEIALKDLNWLGSVPLGKVAQAVHARIRSGREPVPASIREDGEGARVMIAGGEFGVSPGQACVLYDGVGSGAKMLGGGFIARS
jgi:tRNA-specific 2-thiouridylase